MTTHQWLAPATDAHRDMRPHIESEPEPCVRTASTLGPIRHRRRHHEGCASVCLTRQDQTPVQKGDILVTRVPRTDGSYFHQFVKVASVAPSHYFRVRVLASTTAATTTTTAAIAALAREPPTPTSDDGHCLQVWPDHTQRLQEPMILRPDGCGAGRQHAFFRFHHYTPDTVVMNRYL